MKPFPNRLLIPFLVLSILALLAALWAGLARLAATRPDALPGNAQHARASA